MTLSKDDALKRLWEKWYIVARTDNVSYRGDCSLCDFAGRTDSNDANCKLCYDTFGELLGFDEEFSNPCYGASYGNIEYVEIWRDEVSEKGIKRFANALCKHLESLGYGKSKEKIKDAK